VEATVDRCRQVSGLLPEVREGQAEIGAIPEIPHNCYIVFVDDEGDFVNASENHSFDCHLQNRFDTLLTVFDEVCDR
jgi:hypothetical protein